MARHRQGRVQEIEKGRLKTFQTTSSGKSTEQKDKANHFDKHYKEIVTD
ncbi:hypothetical protein MCC93_06060 [Morococcus cerebrosus]|uniref:Uncharacterized protein n=1 Tax=Morococcus cerebrosus TaxID=1056807 RepID=A0A0C1GXW2_9NEIS|nr:hypothetical protein MCC93_06060 [Morococcus cerebrosus]